MTKSDEKSYEDVKITNKDEVIDNKSKESEVVIRHIFVQIRYIYISFIKR